MGLVHGIAVWSPTPQAPVHRDTGLAWYPLNWRAEHLYVGDSQGSPLSPLRGLLQGKHIYPFPFSLLRVCLPYSFPQPGLPAQGLLLNTVTLALVFVEFTGEHS